MAKKQGILHERALLLAIVTIPLGFYFEHSLAHAGLPVVGVSFLVLLGVILYAAFSVAHHAEELAHRLGEPYGTLILTGAAVSVEVIMLAILIGHGDNPGLVRDTIYAAIMIDTNGILGAAAILGGLMHKVQRYNVDSSDSFLTMILVSVGVGMMVPDFIKIEHWQTYSIFNIIVMALMYGVFTRLQTIEHRYFFSFTDPKSASQEQELDQTINPWYHGLILILLIACIGTLAEIQSVFLSEGLRVTGMPLALAGVMIALISASPEILTALKAAMQNRMQIAVNIALGATLSTVLLTIPVVEFVALVSGIKLEMGLTPIQGGMILISILAAIINFKDGGTNTLEGLVHFVLFLTFVVLLFLV